MVSQSTISGGQSISHRTRIASVDPSVIIHLVYRRPSRSVAHVVAYQDDSEHYDGSMSSSRILCRLGDSTSSLLCTRTFLKSRSFCGCSIAAEFLGRVAIGFVL